MQQPYNNILCTRYPRLFRNRWRPPGSSVQHWSFECDIGWFAIIDRACDLITRHVYHARRRRVRALLVNRAMRRARRGDFSSLERIYYQSANKQGWDIMLDELSKDGFPYTEVPENFTVVADQIKEKWGSLRFYCTGGDDYVAGVIAMAETMSSLLCGSCGRARELPEIPGEPAPTCGRCQT